MGPEGVVGEEGLDPGVEAGVAARDLAGVAGHELGLLGPEAPAAAMLDEEVGDGDVAGAHARGAQAPVDLLAVSASEGGVEAGGAVEPGAGEGHAEADAGGDVDGSRVEASGGVVEGVGLSGSQAGGGAGRGGRRGSRRRWRGA